MAGTWRKLGTRLASLLGVAAAATTVAALAFGAVLVVPVGPAAAATPRSLIIVAGQSNASGQWSFAVDPTSRIDYLAAPYSNGADSASRITWWQSCVTKPKQFPPVPLDTPQKSTTNGDRQIFGPEIGLSREVYDETGQRVTIAKAAFANTTISRWSPKLRYGLYADMQQLIRVTVANDLKAGYADTVTGILWYQGESDALVPADAADYQQNLDVLLSALRADVSSTAPIVLAKEDISTACQLSQLNCAGNVEVRAADDWAATHLSNVYEVDTAGLPRLDVGMHLSNQAELQLGEAVALYM